MARIGTGPTDRPPELPELFRGGEAAAQAGRELTWRLLALARRWRVRIDERLEATGLTHTRWQALFWIAEHGGEASQQQVADRVGVASSTMVRTIDGLVAQGLVTRTGSGEDKRANMLGLTPAAHSILDEIRTVWDQVRDEVMAALDPAEIAICDLVLRKMLANLIAVQGGGDPSAGRSDL